MREADSIVLVMDGQLGLTAADEEIVSWLRRTHPAKPLLLAVNKCENPHKADLQASRVPLLLRVQTMVFCYLYHKPLQHVTSPWHHA